MSGGLEIEEQGLAGRAARVLQAPREEHSTGAKNAPNSADATSRPKRDAEMRPRAASLPRTVASAAPPYKSVAVVAGPTPRPSVCTAGIVAPNVTAAARASKPPTRIGFDSDVFTRVSLSRDPHEGPEESLSVRQRLESR